MALHPVDGPAGVEFDAALLRTVEDVVTTVAMDVIDRSPERYQNWRPPNDLASLRLGQDIAHATRVELSRRFGLA